MTVDLVVQLVVAVGTPITRRPPHGSVRAEFPHTALTLDEWRSTQNTSCPLPAPRGTTRRANPSAPTLSSGRGQLSRCSPWSVAFPPGSPPTPRPRAIVRTLRRYYATVRLP